MDRVATMAANTCADLFREAAARRRLPPGLVEKDFWVCWVLIFGDAPTFDEILATLTDLEDKINR